MRALQPSRFLIVMLVLGYASMSFAENLGPDDRQVSFTGPTGSTESDAFTPAIAFDEGNQRYLTVWSADETDGDFQVYGQLLSGASGASVGSAFVIGATGGTGNDHRQPAVAFDDVHNQYLVVWSCDMADAGSFEIHGQLVTVDGQLLGPNHRYSDMGTVDSDPTFDAVTPDLAWHAGLDAFVVVWAGDDDTGDLSDGRFELYGQLVAGASGAEIGANDFRISYAGPDANGNDATNPAIAVADDPARWFVAFEGDIYDDGNHDPEVLIYGGTGDTPDESAFLVSIMGTGFNDGFSARNPDLTWSPGTGELVCIWDGQDDAISPRSVYGQRVLTDGTLVGGELNLSAPFGQWRECIEPAIAINPLTDAWFVTWRGDLIDGTIQRDHEIWARDFDSVGTPIGIGYFSISAMDPAQDPVAGAKAPAVAINAVHGYKLVVWSGDLATTPGGEHEIFAQGWVDGDPSAVGGPPSAVGFSLHGAVPNPFNPVTTIAYELPQAAPVTLRIYDAAGRLVRTLLAETPVPAGRNDVVWNGLDDAGRQAASGVYLYRLETPSHHGHGRMTLVK